MLSLERIGYRHPQCRVLSYGIFVILLFILMGKMRDGIDFLKLQNLEYIEGVFSVADKCGAVSAFGNGLPCDDREAADYYSAVFEKLLQEGYLRPTSKSLCINCAKGQEAVAMERVNISDVVQFSGKRIAPVSASGQGFLCPFGNNTFDFEFFSPRIDRTDVWSVHPLETASEVCRTLRPGGYLVVHVAIKDEYSFQSFVSLFNSCGLLRFRDARRLNSPYSIREVVFTKNSQDYAVPSYDDFTEGCKDNKTVPEYKWDLMRSLEPLPGKEPAEDWTEWEKYQEAIKSFKYLPNMVDLRFKKRYVYIDLGARTYDSTIGNWFVKLYPKQDTEFEVFAIEADKAFHAEYKNKKGITLLPYAAWTKNATLVFGTRNKRREYTGKIQQDQTVTQDYAGEQNIVQAFDFADWLIRSFTKRDFVVLKMDVEGTEMDLVPRLVETGAICLIDELFIECHYDRWVKCCSGERTQRYNTTYQQCFDLFSNLRQQGSLVHQWW